MTQTTEAETETDAQSSNKTVEVDIERLEAAVRELETLLDSGGESESVGGLEAAVAGEDGRVGSEESEDEDAEGVLGEDAPIECSVNHGQLRTVAHAAAEFVEYVAIQFTTDALKVNVPGVYHVMHVSATIPITDWNTPPRTGLVVVDTADLTDQLPRRGDQTEIRADPEANRLTLVEYGIPYGIKTDDVDLEPDSPSGDYARKHTTRARLPGYQLAAGLSGASAASDMNVGIAIQEDAIHVGAYRRDEDAYATRLTFDAETTGPRSASTYSEGFTSDIAKHIPREGTVELQLRNDYPMVIEAGFIRYDLAPRAVAQEDGAHASNLLNTMEEGE